MMDPRQRSIAKQPQHHQQQQQSIPMISHNNRMKSSNNNQQQHKWFHNIVSLEGMMVCLLYGCMCFYIGLLVGTGSSNNSSGCINYHGVNDNNTTSKILFDPKIEDTIRQRVTEQVRLLMSEKDKQQQQKKSSSSHTADDTSTRFPSSISEYMVGMSLVDRTEFANVFSDVGVPLDETTDHNQHVLLLYQSEDSIPNHDLYVHDEILHQTTIPYINNVNDAVKNCDQVHIILSNHNTKRKQCMAIMGQYEAFHIQKFMRLPERNEANEQKRQVDSNMPLRFVSRGSQDSGRISTKPPSQDDTLKYWNILKYYFTNLPIVLEHVKMIADPIAKQNDNTIIVLVCNLGQSDLLLNFICNAKHKKISLNAILVFATDIETRDLMVSMNIPVFYDEWNYGTDTSNTSTINMPKKAAGRYADTTFTSMMLSKVFCVHILSMLGYNILFQDVDVIWYRNPLEYFHNNNNNDNPMKATTNTSSTKINHNFDVYFQDDGNHALFYAPYSANTGFYYVRNNERTRHFINNLLIQGDLIYSTHSHQIPLVALLQEHASMYGLKIKIFARQENDFPGGHAFHRRDSYMRDIFNGIMKPYIFHMSWTNNKFNKIKFFQQINEWYVHDQCMEKTVSTIMTSKSSITIENECCSIEPLFQCHYRDKPSIKSCADKPPIDKGQKSWWK